MATEFFRDPLYNYISIDKDRDRWLLELLDSPEMQRLRRIHQLGISYLTYPSATHNRLAHSLGVVHLMQKALGHLAAERPDLAGDEVRQPLLAAALLHDVGHGPFSHLFESCLGFDHEAWSCRLIRSPEGRAHQILRRVDGTLPEAVAALIETDNPLPPRWQKSLLSSQLDVDRLDYLQRDSLFTGAGYGHFDWFRLLHTFTLHGAPDHEADVVWTERALYAIEEYLFARFYMYQIVYLHATTRGFEKMLHALWARARSLRREGRDIGLLPPLAAVWEAPAPTAPQYLAVEEFVVLTQIQAWTGHPDRPLSDLARRFLDRRHFAAIEAPAEDGPEWRQVLEELAVRNGYAPADAYVLRDDLETTIYSAYAPATEGPAPRPLHTIRLVRDPGEPPEEISRFLPRLQTVTAAPARQARYYLPGELRADALALRRTWGR